MGILRSGFDDLLENGLIGDWCFHESTNGLEMFFRYPLREDDEKLGDWWPYSDAKTKGDVVRIPLTSKVEKNWGWNENKESPTLTPSINVVGRWHGFFRDGKLETLE